MAKKKKEKKFSSFVDKPFDFVLFIVILLLLSLGIVMVLSASAPSALAKTGNSYEYVVTQVVSAVIGIILMLFISKIDYRFYKKFYKILYAFIIILNAIVMIPGIGYTANEATRWINLGFTTFQPSEIAKIALIIFYAVYLTDNRDKLNKWKSGFLIPFLILVPIILILVLIQDHLSATLVIVAIVSIMMLTAGTKLKHFILTGVPIASAGVLGLVLLAKFTDKGAFRLARLTAFLDPWQDALRFRVSNNSKFICNRFRWIIWVRFRK